MNGNTENRTNRTRPAIWLGVSVAIIAAVVAAILVFKPPSPPRLPLVKVNIVTWPGYGPIYVAQAKGFFKEEGVEVDCQIQENTQARHAALVSGEIDLVGITLESVILANAEGIPMQVVGITDISDGGDGIVAKKEIQSIKDLKGKRVAFPEGQPSHLFLLYHLEKAGLSSKELTPVLTDDAGKAGEVFVAGDVDAAVTWEPWLSKSSEGGRGHVLVSSKGVSDILIGILAANRTNVSKSEDKLQRFFRAWYRGLDYVQQKKSDAVPIMAKAFKLPAEEFEEMMGGLRFIDKTEAKKMLGDANDRGTFFSVCHYEESLWRKAGIIKKQVDCSEVYTGAVIRQVK